MKIFKKVFVLTFVLGLLVLGGCITKQEAVVLKGIKLNEEKAIVFQGDKFELETNATALMSDNTSKTVAVKWDKQVNTNEITEGDVYVATYSEGGIDASAKFTLVVKPLKLNLKNADEDIKFNANGLGVSTDEIITLEGIENNSEAIVKLNGNEISDFKEMKLLKSKDNVIEVKLKNGDIIYKKTVLFIESVHIVGSVVGEGANDWEPKYIDDNYNGISKMKYIGSGKFEATFRTHYRVVNWMRADETGANYAFKFAINGFLGGVGDGMELAGKLGDKSSLGIDVNLERSRLSSKESGLKNLLFNLEPAAEYKYTLDILKGVCDVKKTNNSLKIETKLAKEEDTVKKGEIYTLPKQVELLVGGTQKELLNVEWDKPADTNTTGNFNYEGTILDNDGKAVDIRYLPIGISNKVFFTLKVEPTDKEKVLAAKDKLTISGDLTQVTSDLSLPSNIDEVMITWGTNNSGVITTSGKVTRPAKGAGNSTVELTATLKFGDVTETKVITLTVLESDKIIDTEAPVITLTGASEVNLKVGATYEESGATAKDNVDVNLKVIIGGDTVDTSKAGTYTVTYNVTDLAGNKATEVKRTVIVEAITVTEVKFVYSEVTIKEEETNQLQWVVKPLDAKDKTVTFVSSDSAVATVDASGMVTGVSAGTATITVTTKDGNKTDECTITVEKKNPIVNVTGITVGAITVTLKKDESKQLDWTVEPENATDKTVTFASSDSAVATVDETGVVTGISTGTAKLTVTTKDGGKIAEVNITVEDSVVEKYITVKATFTGEKVPLLGSDIFNFTFTRLKSEVTSIKIDGNVMFMNESNPSVIEINSDNRDAQIGVDPSEATVTIMAMDVKGNVLSTDYVNVQALR